MIQGLLGESSSSGLIESGPERSKLSVPSPSSSATAAPPTTSGNLRCPRCDSTNTKFCYYNNYNLTQPRHFCKTCRRYWTKGGALRNVPIGGGCRKNRTTTTATATIISSPPISKSNAVKFQKAEIGKSGNNFISSLELNPVFWAPPQNSHLLSLLRPNPNPNESTFFEPAAHHISNSETAVASGALSGLGWRNNQQQQNGFTIEDLQSSGLMHDFYQRLRSSSTNYHQDLANSSSTNSTILESAAVGVGDQLGYWNNPLLSNWSDLPATTHGAYP